jgi:hypothetical protein
MIHAMDDVNILSDELAQSLSIQELGYENWIVEPTFP